MDIETAIYNHLAARSGLTALVGDRIYFDTLPQNCQYPAVTITLVAGIDDHCLTEDPGTAEDTYQLTAWAANRSDAVAVAKQVNLAFRDFSGVMGGTGGVNIGSVLQEGRADRVDIISNTLKIYSRNEDYVFQYEKE